MTSLVLAWAVCLGVSVPMIVLALECLAGLPRSDVAAAAGEPPPFIVLMPAHDEAEGIAAAAGPVMAQLRPCDRLLVIADNCTDDTATIARSLGATVIERHDPVRRGKGYALEFARDALAASPDRFDAELIIVVDADCRPEGGALQALAATAAVRGCAVQGAYLMVCPEDAAPVVRVSCFAFLVKNLARQRGLERLAGVALLQGSGMGFPRALFARVCWSTGSLVEDLEMGLDLLLNGEAVGFAAAARFTSAASSTRGTGSQRRRWEHGMLIVMRRFVPRLAAAALRQGRARLMVVALDLMVPPTVLLGAVALVGTGLVVLFAGPTLPTAIMLVADLAGMMGIAAVWWREGRGVLPPRRLGELAGYVLWKLPILAQFVTRRERQWIRTERQP